MQTDDLKKLALSFKNKSKKIRDLAPLYEYAKKNNISDEDVSKIIQYTGL